MISIISSVGKNREIGKNNKLIWHIPNDMKFFKETTMGHTVVMGRCTYESLPGDLPGREMVVVTSTVIDENVQCIDSIEKVIEKFSDTLDEVFIIGGASIYHQFIQYADRLYLTEINASHDDADTFFPEFDKNKWERIVLGKDVYNGIEYTICRYDKKVM